MKRYLLFVLGLSVAACTDVPMVDVPSANQESRINHLVMHFTSEHFEESMRLLTGEGDSPVSVHYVVPEPGDETYPDDSLRVYRLVHEPRRARHAGVSYWARTRSLNNSSIGIEIVNQSRCESSNPEAEEQTPEMLMCTFLEYPEEQIEMVIRLAQGILDRHPDIDPVDVIAHGDIAPDRRVDPGPLFPWKRFHDAGIGAWYDDDTKDRYLREFQRGLPSLTLVQRALGAYGYLVEPTGEMDVQTRFVLRAFQMHFRPSDYGGAIDAESVAILFALLEKYRPNALERLNAEAR